jgi:hypothetical protein
MLGFHKRLRSHLDQFDKVYNVSGLLGVQEISISNVSHLYDELIANVY